MAREELAEEQDEDEENEPVTPEELGTLYDITLSYTVEYRFRLPAYSKHDAERIAKELTLDAQPADSYHVHTDRREVETVMSDDHRLPDDFDPYGGELLLDAFGRAQEAGGD